MGKGGGCVPSKKRPVAPPPTSEDAAAAAPSPRPEVLSPQLPTHPPSSRRVKVFIVFYSMYGHVESLAKELKKGVDSVEGVEGFLFRVPETLPPEVLEKMGAPEKDESVPVIGAGGEELLEADGVVFGFPTRYGAMAVQMKAFFDSTGGLWREQKLAGKPAGFFVSTGTQGGGQETTA